VKLTPAQERNLRAALAVTDNVVERERLAFAIWTESRALVTANGGLNTSKSRGFDTHPQWPGILRRSLSMAHDAVGNNGRSTGILQQISDDVGGVWGSMAGTMDPATSARRFLAALKVTNNRFFVGTLQTPTGSERVIVELSDPIAADVLRVQQPLADEARSSNYDASKVAIAREIVAQLFPTTQPAAPDLLETIMADRHPFIWFRYNGSLCEADVWNKTWSRIPNELTMNDRKYVLAVANFPEPLDWHAASGHQEDVANPAAFGREIPWAG